MTFFSLMTPPRIDDGAFANRQRVIPGPAKGRSPEALL
jgi:hypothetical protein